MSRNKIAWGVFGTSLLIAAIPVKTLAWIGILVCALAAAVLVLWSKRIVDLPMSSRIVPALVGAFVVAFSLAVLPGLWKLLAFFGFWGVLIYAARQRLRKPH